MPKIAQQGLALFLLCLVSGVTVEAEDAIDRELLIKASVLYKMLKFVEWPKGAEPQPSVLQLCTVGTSDLQHALSALEGKAVRGRALQIKTMQLDDPVQACQVIFFGHTSSGELQKTLHNLSGSPILSVSEYDKFLNDGGMIRIGAKNNQVSFDVNLKAARDQNIKINHQLLTLADNVIQ